MEKYPMQNILILYSDTGGGHRASAQALQLAFEQHYSGQNGERLRVTMADPWANHTPWPINRMPRAYPFLANDAVWVYRLLWRATASSVVSDPIFKTVMRVAEQRIELFLQTYHPDLIVCVHPLLQALLRAARRKMYVPPVVTVVTDLATAHPLWFDRGVRRCYVASREATARGRLEGMRAEQMRKFGLPVRAQFAQPALPKETLRLQLGLKQELPTALLMGGGDGMGRLSETVRLLTSVLRGQGQPSARPLGQIVVICGRNERLRTQLASHNWPVPLRALGFVDNIADWMSASDCLVTKAGPGTIAEALTRGLPLILSGFLPEQERGNLRFVVDNGTGIYTSDAFEIADAVRRWFTSERALLQEMSVNARALGQPHAAAHIVNDIATLLPQPLPAAGVYASGH